MQAFTEIQLKEANSGAVISSDPKTRREKERLLDFHLTDEAQVRIYKF